MNVNRQQQRQELVNSEPSLNPCQNKDSSTTVEGSMLTLCPVPSKKSSSTEKVHESNDDDGDNDDNQENKSETSYVYEEIVFLSKSSSLDDISRNGESDDNDTCSFRLNSGTSDESNGDNDDDEEEDDDDDDDEDEDDDARGFRAKMKNRMYSKSSFNTVSSCSFRSMPSLRSIDELTDSAFFGDDVNSLATPQRENASINNFSCETDSVYSTPSTVDLSRMPSQQFQKQQQQQQQQQPSQVRVAFLFNSEPKGGILKEALDTPCTGGFQQEQQYDEDSKKHHYQLRWDNVAASSGSNRSLQPPSRPPVTPQQIGTRNVISTSSTALNNNNNNNNNIRRESLDSTNSNTASPATFKGTRKAFNAVIRKDCRPIMAIRVPSLSSLASSLDSTSLDELPSC